MTTRIFGHVLNIRQIEKHDEKYDAMKTKKLSEASINTDKLVGMTILPYYAIPYSLWQLSRFAGS